MIKYVAIAVILIIAYSLNNYLDRSGSSYQDGEETTLPSLTNQNEETDDENILLAAPLKDRSELMLRHTNYIVSYNEQYKVPNYVAWEVNKQELEKNVQRVDEFTPDPLLGSKEAVISQDYSRSGYDRGHMCPAADNLYSQKSMEECFYMTNMCPQDHELNQGRWNDLEIKCRDWTMSYGQLLIACGPIFKEGSAEKYIGKYQKVRVPDAFFKVIVTTSVSPQKAIAVVFDNSPEANERYCSIDEVEKMTGMDFFHNLPDDIENRIEAECESAQWRF